MIRSQISRALDRVGALSALLALRSRTSSPWLPVLTYHRVAETTAAKLYDDGVVDVTPDAFDRQLTFLKKWFNVVDLDTVFAFRAGKALPKNPVLITFDDGYKDNLDVALPILQRHGVKATFFIATHYIGERRLFWWDRANYFLKSSTKESIALTYPNTLTLRLGPDKNDLARSIRKVLRVIKDHHGLDLPRFLDELAVACGVTLSRAKETELVNALLMTWDEVRAMRRAGMDVQSHTHTHRVLQTLPKERYKEELGGSREILEGILGERVRAISYPVGKPLAYTPDIRSAVRDAGYELGFSNGTGTNSVWSFDPFDAKRLAVDVDLPDSQFAAMLALPYLAY